jgi:hypothetical protein
VALDEAVCGQGQWLGSPLPAVPRIRLRAHCGVPVRGRHGV